MSAAQLEELMAQVEQLTLVNSKLQQELTNNSTHLARLESAMQRRRGARAHDDESLTGWSLGSSNRSSRSEEPGASIDMVQQPKSTELSSLANSHGANKNIMVSSKGTAGLMPAIAPIPVRIRQRAEAIDGDWSSERRERRDSGSCDHTESEMNGLVYRDVSTNTPSAQQVHFAELPGADHAVGPGVISSDRHGNELITIGTQTTEVVMTADCEHQPVVENIRGCSKAATPQQLSDFYHGAWPIVVDGKGSSSQIQDTQSVMSFHSSISSHSSRPSHHFKEPSNRVSNQQTTEPAEVHSVPIALQPLSGSQPLGSKVQMVYSLLSMLGTHDPEDMSQTLLAMSSSADSCAAMRQSGCLPLLVQLIYGSEADKGSLTAGRVCRARACKALHNIVHSKPDDKKSRREVKILKYLETVQAHCEAIREDEQLDHASLPLAESIWPPSDMDRDPGPAVAALMKLSFDDHGRQPICALGGLHCMSQLIKFDQSSYNASSDLQRVTMRRYACMTLTNLTFGDSANKARLCAMQSCLDAIVLQLQSFNEDLCQVAASVIRNLSWKADQASKRHLRLSRAATKLMITAVQVGKESTLKSILSALWNLSAHCTYNKTCICEVDGSIEFLVNMLSYQSPSRTLAIVECSGGILRNISSVIAVRDDYRQILRNHNALEILLSHLKSPSLAIVGNACGALWNISARCPDDQRALIELSAIPMLKNLTTSKHRLISLGSAATIKNLLAFKAEGSSGKSCKMSKTSSNRREGTECNQEENKQRTVQDYSNSSSIELSKVQKTGSQDSVGSCSSLTNREGLTTLNKIENIMQEVMQANMEMHQLKRVPSSTHSSDTRINSGSSTPRSKPVASNFTLMTKSSDYPLQASTNPVRQISTSGNNSALSPRVHHKRSSGTSHNSAAFFAPSMPTHPLNDNRFSMMSAGSGEADDRSSRANFSMTYNDDNIDNSSEKPVDYSQMYRESGSVYELPLTNSGISSSNYGSSALQRQHMNYGVSQLPAAFLHHDPAMLLQTSSGSFMDPSYFMDFDIPSLEQIKAKAMAEKPAVAQQAPRQAPRQRTAATSGSRAMPELSRIEDQHGEDQVKTFCTEGTPMNYLSTATSMNELNKIGEEAISEKDEHSVSSQPTSTQSQVNEDSTKLGNSSEAKQGLRGKVPTMITSAPKHQEEGEDEPPKTYATEDTPLTGISRVSSLSSLNSAIDAKGTSTNGMSRESVPAPLALPTQGGLERIHEDEVLSPSSHAKAPLLKTPLEQKSVSFDEHAHVQETPMMFSRASSLASLSSCDQQSIHSSVFSDYSRRASQVVSPSDLPDSPGGTTQHSPTTRRKIKERTELRKDAQTPPLVPTEQLSSTQYSQPPPDPASQNLASLLGLSGMFGSLSGLASLQGPEVSNELTNNYAQHLLDQYCQPTHQVSAHPQFQQAQYGTQHTPNLPQHIPKQMVTESLMTRTDALVQNAEALQAPARLIHNTSQLDRTRQQFANSDLTVTGNSSAQPKSLSEPSNLSEVAKGAPEMKRPGILRSTAPVIAPVSSSSMHSIQKASLSANSKVDQFLSDTVRTYAVEGTPGPNSTRSSLSALTFLDEPEVPLSTLTMLRSSMSKESIGTAAAMSSSLKPLDLSMKVKPAAEVVNDGSNEEPPPLPPKPASLGVKKKEQSDTTACASAASSTNQAADGAPAKVMERSRTVSESMNDSDSSSDGDDLMLQQCISSALPLPSNRGKLPKSSSDSQVTAAASRQVSKGVPRSKTTFGSKLRMPSKRILKSTQLAKQRQAPPIVSANSPTPDDDHFAEETVMAYCTEDTPYNKSTATSLSDLSVIDDELNELDKSDGETEAKPSEVVVKEATKQQACAGALSASDTSSDSDGDNLLSNAIFSAIPKKSCKLSQLEEPEQKDKGAGPSSEKPSLKYTSNELRATDVKFQTSADSIRNYATEGTPNNFSTSTSLSDLTIDSHYSTSRSTGSKPTSKQPVKSIANHSSPSRLPSLLPKRQGSATGPPSQTPLTRLPQASSSPMQRATHLPTSLLQKGPQSISNAQCKTPTAAGLMDNDEMKSFGVEGTPFNYSRRESLSSLSCDEEEEDGVNVTIIDRVTEAMQRRVQDGNQGKGSPVSQSTVGQSNSSHSSRKITGSEASAERVGFAVATHQRPTLVVTDGIIDRLNLPQSDGFQSRDEMTKTYTPIEGTPYCFSRNSPLSSLSSSCDSLPGAGMASIGQAHQAEGGVSDSSESDSEASQGSFTTSQTFLDQCISSALPKKPSMLPLATKTSKIYKGSNSTKPSGKPSTLKKQPPSPLPKPVHVKPSPVNLLPSSGEMVVSQRSSKGVSTDTSTDSVKSDHVSSSTATISTSPSSVSTVYKSTQERRLSAGERELRRRTYTVTTSEVQSAIALLTDTSNGPSIESNIEISGDEDEFEDVFLIENGELLKQDVNAILAAIEEAAKEPEDKFFNMVTLNLPAPPSCIVEDSSTAPELVSSVDEEDHGVANEGTGETPNKCGHRGPRITKPNINSAEPISDLEKSKAIRGCRKPLYPGRKLNTEGATKKAVSGVGAKSSLSRQSKIARAPESPFRKFNSKVKESHGPSKPTNSVKPVYSQRSQVISRSNNNIPQMNAKSSRISTPVKRNQTSAHQNSPNVASAKRVGKNTASDNDTAAAASQLGKTSTAALRSTSALRSVSCNSRNVTPPGPTQSSPKSAVRPSSLPRTKEKNAAGKLVSRVDSVGAASTSRDALGEMAAVKGREGKAVSPSAALHRAAGDGAMSSGCQKKRASTRNFAKPHQLPYLPPGSKQQTSSRITGLAKVKPSQMSSSKRAENGTTNSSGGNSLTGNSAYVSSISFREPRGEGNHCHKKSAALLPDSCKTESQGDSTDSERHSHSSADSSSASDRVSSTPIAVINSAPRLSAGVSAGSAPCITTSAVASVSTSSSHSVVSDLEQKLPDKNSAVVSPFMYKAQQRSATDTSHRQSVTGDRLGSYTSSGAELSDDDVFTSGYTPQAHFYGQDNKITVQLDIKPCITLSDVSQTLAGDKSPHQYQLSHYNLKPTYDANMTKTEMLLRRRSEILNRRQDSQSSRWQPSKTTDV